MKRVEKNSYREECILKKQSSVESNSSDDVEYGPDTEFIHACKRIFSVDKPIAAKKHRYPGEFII